MTGATMRELLASHLFLQLIMLIVHCIELYIVTYSIFGNPLEGSSFFIIVMLAITALTGALAGWYTSIQSNDFRYSF